MRNYSLNAQSSQHFRIFNLDVQIEPQLGAFVIVFVDSF